MPDPLNTREQRIMVAMCREVGPVTEDYIAFKAWGNWNKSHTNKRRIPQKIKIVRVALRGLRKRKLVQWAKDSMWGHWGWEPTKEGRSVAGF